MRSLNKLIFIVFILFSSFQILFAQTINYPKGGYKDYFELKSKKPSIPFVFDIEKRSQGDIFMVGGSDYKIEPTDKSIKKRDIKKTIYAISTGDTLYLNCYMQVASSWYSKIISEGKYLVFFGPVFPGYTSFRMGGGIEAGMIAKMRLLYVLDTDLEFATAKHVDKSRLEKILKPFPDLFNQYNNENKKDDPEVLLEYLLHINDKYQN